MITGAPGGDHAHEEVLVKLRGGLIQVVKPLKLLVRSCMDPGRRYGFLTTLACFFENGEPAFIVLQEQLVVNLNLVARGRYYFLHMLHGVGTIQRFGGIDPGVIDLV